MKGGLAFLLGKEGEMRKLTVFLYVIVFAFALVGVAKAALILFEDFEDSSGFTSGGNASYWGIAPLGGTQSYSSQFIQGGSQSGNIFYGVHGNGATMTISLPDLTGYYNLQLNVALAAPEGIWEYIHRDSLYITGTSGQIDSIRPQMPLPTQDPRTSYSLRSQIHSIDLDYQFQDFEYVIDSNLNSLTFTFAATADAEFVGIDSVRITGAPVPEPTTLLLLGTGIIGLIGFRRKFKK